MFKKDLWLVCLYAHGLLLWGSYPFFDFQITTSLTSTLWWDSSIWHWFLHTSIDFWLLWSIYHASIDLLIHIFSLCGKWMCRVLLRCSLKPLVTSKHIMASRSFMVLLTNDLLTFISSCMHGTLPNWYIDNATQAKHDSFNEVKNHTS